jgi:hypothetical protein
MTLRTRLSLERLEERETPSPIGPQPIDPTQPPPPPASQTPDPGTYNGPQQPAPPTGGPTYF